MSINLHQETVSTPSESTAPAASETPAAEPAASPGSEVAPPAAAEGAAKPAEGAEAPAEGDPETPPPFTPKEKFKAFREEHEVPKWVRDLIKDPETEEKAIKMLEKAYGLDAMKPKFEETKAELATARGEHSSVLGQINEAREIYQRGDIDLWLQRLGVPAERMLQWALDKVNYSQLPPEQQRIIDQKTDAERRAWQLEKQAGSQGQQFLEQQRATIVSQLDSGLTRPDVQTFAEAFDSKAGQPGAFRKEVASLGETVYARTQGQTLLSPDQAIQMTIEKYKNFVEAQQQAQPGQAGGSPAAKVIVQAQKPGTIPNVQGKAASPMKSQPNSIDDLRKLAREAQARG